jgi:hypothetical protein
MIKDERREEARLVCTPMISAREKFKSNDTTQT